ncbi:CLUMA_CG005836, isoform A [Clunio marinus]|uniref:CLUMA_CG005836, isoform A n=1 Tax=Clunio marinus TaxID=568069 RepID=A0A1J1HVT1_9DIPT|nr:CLUMA_CG005836, isoform A [Clunio marinus]
MSMITTDNNFIRLRLNVLLGYEENVLLNLELYSTTREARKQKKQQQRRFFSSTIYVNHEVELHKSQ